MTIDVSTITDTSSGIFKVTGPCSMATPCVGDTCPTHGAKTEAALVTVSTYDVHIGGKRIGFVSVGADHFIGYNFRGFGTSLRDPGSSICKTLDEAVAGIIQRYLRGQR